LAYRVDYKASVIRDLKKLLKEEVRRIVDTIEHVLGDDPNAGTPLKGPFRGMYRYRIGEYRVIHAMTRDGVLVLRVGHRTNVYK